jgi:uncharacterized protein YkwD
MEGGTLRREAGSTIDPQTGRPAAPPTPRLGAPRRAAARIAVGSLALGLAFAVPQAVGLGVPSAHAAKCRSAHRAPHQVSHKHARRAVVCMINKMRRHHGRRGLHVRGALNESGRRHSSYMRRHGCFSHQCPGERNLIDRVVATSYLPCGCRWRLGENIARGARMKATPAAIVRAWMHSPPHRAEILNRRLRDVGVGVVWGRRGNRHAKVGNYTADFGSRRG